MTWEHSEIIEGPENISIFSSINKKICEAKIWEAAIKTGKQRVFMGYRTSVAFDGKIFSSKGYHSSRIDALKDLATALGSSGYEIRVWGLSNTFYETGLSFNSGMGYSKGNKNIVFKLIQEIK